MRLLLTGEPGVGKTTIIKQVINELPAAFWVVSEEILGMDGARKGFGAKNSSGLQGVFAHKTDIISEAQIGSFKVDLEVIDRVFTIPINQALENRKELFIIDEIGRMEMLSPMFESAIDRIFSAPIHLVATIRQGDQWAAKYTSGSDVQAVFIFTKA